MRKYAIALLLFFLFAPNLQADVSDTLQILERIPVQSGGRVKPFQSFALESLLFVTNTKSYEHRSASETVWQWMADPEAWNSKPFIPVGYRPLREELGAGVVQGKAAPKAILEGPFLQGVKEAAQKDERKEALTPLEKERISLYNRALLFQKIGIGLVPGWIAHPESPEAGWFPFQSFAAEAHTSPLTQYYAEEHAEMVRQSLLRLLENLRADGGSVQTLEAARKFSASLEALHQSRGLVLDQANLDREIRYLRRHPFGWAWKFYLATLVLAILFAVIAREHQRPKQSQNRRLLRSLWSLAMTSKRTFLIVTFCSFLLGFLAHTYGFYLRCLIAGRPPVTNMYESIIWVSWAVCFFAGLLFVVYKTPLVVAVASAVASLALGIAESFPTVLDPSISPLVPVLRSNLWLTVHVLTITLSYGAFALAWGLGHVVIFRYAFFPKDEEKNMGMVQYLYRAVQIGVLLLAAGTVLGGVWANYSWGRFWGWDPKETWALIALLGYLAVLHGRSARWVGPFGLAAGCVVAFALVVMAWYGVNYVLAAGLHSYGFGGGGALYVFGVALLDLFLVSALSWKYCCVRV